MSKKKSYITVTDQFCGAGGSGQAAQKVLAKRGGKVAVALNHWKLATETYQQNQTDTLVDCTDISACDPRRYPSTDGLITSPECTTHTPAGGNTHKQLKVQMDMFNKNIIDPATERSRATMWDVCRFAEYHKYNFIIVENVVEAKTRWALFDTWLQAMHVLGYNHKCVYQNSMHHHPTPQSRDRMYIVFWKKGNKTPNLNYTPKAFCPKCEKDTYAVQVWKNPSKQYGKYKQQYLYACPTCQTLVSPYYYAAFNCIDWSDLGTKIKDRKKALSPNTIKRIEYGLKKYGNQPLQVLNYTPGYTKTTDDAFATMRAGDSTGILTPFIVNDLHSSGIDFRVRGSNEQIPSIQTAHQLKLISHPLILKVENGSNVESARSSMEDMQTQLCRQTAALLMPPFIGCSAHGGSIQNTKEPLGTMTTHQNYDLVAPPFIIEMHRTGNSIEITDVVYTATAGGIKTGLVTNESFNSFISYYYKTPQESHITEPANSVRTGDCFQLINYKEPKIEDCYYRMLKPHEIKLAMAFNPDYKILGSGKDQVKQLGNAVTPPVMEWLVEQCVESLN